jgi:hypothetical protein
MVATIKDKLSEVVEKFIKVSKPLPEKGEAMKKTVEAAKKEKATK